ncbi:MAG TPA: PPC domain-containing protein, partial [Chthonomonadaceae bacterium]|nr:PPC domain-containing protein [Chthonomonadaceae bacterium]
MRIAGSWIKAAAIAAVFGAAAAAGAQTSFPMIISTYPSGVERGKTVTVTVNAGTVNGGGGANLYGAYSVMMEGEGVKAEIVPPEKGWPAKDPKKPNEVPVVASVSMKVTVAADAPLGVREFRLATPRHGVSTIGQLVIGDEPELMETEPNNSSAEAQQLTIPCVMNGRFQNGEDVDWYKFTVTAGQEVTFAVDCARLEDKIHDIAPHADPMLVVFDSAGNELARNDDYYRADPLVHYKFEKAGEYRVQIRDVNYQGSPHWVYRLNVTSRPYVTSAIPCAVQPGKSQDVRVLGWNLGSQTAHVDVPADVLPGLWGASLKLPNGMSNYVQLLVTEAPQAAYEDTASAALLRKASAVVPGVPEPVSKGALPLPGGVNSWLGAQGQIDRYKFHATKGQALGFEVTARRIDSELDSEIKVRDVKGNVLAANDDAFGKDSRIDWTAPADGDYTLDIRDLTGHGGPTYFYNLTAKPLRPDFRLKCDTDRAMIAP